MQLPFSLLLNHNLILFQACIPSEETHTATIRLSEAAATVAQNNEEDFFIYVSNILQGMQCSWLIFGTMRRISVKCITIPYHITTDIANLRLFDPFCTGMQLGFELKMHIEVYAYVPYQDLSCFLFVQKLSRYKECANI